MLQVVDDESVIIRTIFGAYTDERIGSRAIAQRLNERGYRTGIGGTWSGHQVLRVLGNRVYIGEVTFRDVTVPNAHEPIIDPDTFSSWQTRSSRRAEKITAAAPPTPRTTCSPAACAALSAARP